MEYQRLVETSIREYMRTTISVMGWHPYVEGWTFTNLR